MVTTSPRASLYSTSPSSQHRESVAERPFRELARVAPSHGGWYFDSRGWGDLAKGTNVEWMVPYQEMQTRAEDIYNGTNVTTAIGTYGY